MIPDPPLAPRIVHAGPGLPLVLASDGRMRTLTTNQAVALLHMTTAELHLTAGDALDLPDVSVIPLTRLDALRLAQQLAGALASNVEAAAKRST